MIMSFDVHVCNVEKSIGATLRQACNCESSTRSLVLVYTDYIGDEKEAVGFPHIEL